MCHVQAFIIKSSKCIHSEVSVAPGNSLADLDQSATVGKLNKLA